MFLEVAPDLIILSHGDRCVHMAWTAHAETRSPKRNGVERSGTADGVESARQTQGGQVWLLVQKKYDPFN